MSVIGRFKKPARALGIAAAFMAAVGLTAAPVTAQARDWHGGGGRGGGGHGGHHGGWGGGGVALGVLGGALAGAAIASAANPYYYGYPAYGYSYAPSYGYGYAPAYGYAYPSYGYYGY